MQTTADVRFLSIGKSGENVALLAFEVARAQNSPEHQLFFRLKNYGAQPHSGVISIYQEDRLLQAHRVQLKPGENHTESYRMVLRQPGLLRAELECDDVLATDNTAYAFAELPSTTSVLLVSPGNLFLEQALLVLPEVQLYKTAGLSPREALEAARRYDVVIYDRVRPPAAPVSGGSLYIDVDSPAATAGAALDGPEH